MRWPAWSGGRVQLWACALLLLPLHSIPVFSRLEEGQCAAEGERYDSNDLTARFLPVGSLLGAAVGALAGAGLAAAIAACCWAFTQRRHIAENLRLLTDNTRMKALIAEHEQQAAEDATPRAPRAEASAWAAAEPHGDQPAPAPSLAEPGLVQGSESPWHSGASSRSGRSPAGGGSDWSGAGSSARRSQAVEAPPRLGPAGGTSAKRSSSSLASLPEGQASLSDGPHQPLAAGDLPPLTPPCESSHGSARVSTWMPPAPASPFAAQSQERVAFDSSRRGTEPGSLGSAAAGSEEASCSRQDSSSSGELLELLQHRAVQDSQSSSGGGSRAGGATPLPAQLVLAALPPGLREWVIPKERVQYVRRADGSLHSLGEGASGRVYKAILNSEVVAAKEMDIGSSLGSQRAFVTEAVRLVLLRHANVVAFYGCCLDGPRGILLCEFCEGGDLHSALQLTATGSTQRLFGWYRRGRRVALEVARALNFLHGKNVVHMDIKSSNVLLSACGTAKLADVGLSRMQTRTVMSDISLVGTFAWAAPEILLGGLNCTKSVDIYSFGVLLYEITTGERPLRGNLRLPRVPEECPQEVVDLMLECLSTNPAARPSAQQLMMRLSSLLGTPLDRLSSRPSMEVGGSRPGPSRRASVDVVCRAAAAAAESLASEAARSPGRASVDGSSMSRPLERLALAEVSE